MTDTLSAQDERKALADKISSAIDQFGAQFYHSPLLTWEDWNTVIAALRAEPARGEEMRERAKIACLDLNDAYREASENHMQQRNLTKAREAMDWAIGALECAHAVAKLPTDFIRALPASHEGGGE